MPAVREREDGESSEGSRVPRGAVRAHSVLSPGFMSLSGRNTGKVVKNMFFPICLISLYDLPDEIARGCVSLWRTEASGPRQRRGKGHVSGKLVSAREAGAAQPSSSPSSAVLCPTRRGPVVVRTTQVPEGPSCPRIWARRCSAQLRHPDSTSQDGGPLPGSVCTQHGEGAIA